MTPVAMKVWSPDKGMTKQMSIANDADHIGNKVAEGDLSKEVYWETLADIRLLRIVQLRKQLNELATAAKNAVTAVQSETSWLIRLAYSITRLWRYLV